MEIGLNGKYEGYPSCRIEYHCNYVPTSSVFSSFSDIQGPEMYSKNFSAFVKSRTNYLESLKKLGKDWISGGSEEPKLQSIKVSQSILRNLELWYLQEGAKNFMYPSIVMSPTPSGGISMEIAISTRLKTHLNIQEDNVELEMEKDGYYSDEEVTTESINDKLSGLYNECGQYYYPRWRDTL